MRQLNGVHMEIGIGKESGILQSVDLVGGQSSGILLFNDLISYFDW